MLTIECKGSIGDMSALTKELNIPVEAWKAALLNVKDRMESSLKEHIQEDVYKAYKPRVYKRRSKNPAYGTPLIDIDDNTYPEGGAHAYPDGKGGFKININYMPTGEHTVYKWSSAGPNGVNGSDLISRIEKNDPPYRWPPSPVERPFWQKYVEEMIDGGGFAEALQQGFASQGYQVTIDSVTRTPDDGNY